MCLKKEKKKKGIAYFLLIDFKLLIKRTSKIYKKEKTAKPAS